jgi:pimeloyl-ACP methyl ester carboxylesterase
LFEKGVFANSISYVRFGTGEQILLVFSGGPGTFLPSRFSIRLLGEFKLLAKQYQIYVMARKTGLPDGYTTRDMAEDYATVINNEFGGKPVDVMGMSYGGLVAQHLAADHPELVRRLVIAMSCYRFSDEGNELDMRFALLLSEGKQRKACSVFGTAMGKGIKMRVVMFFMWLVGPLIFSKPENPHDLVVEGKAEVAHNFKDQLVDIKVPTLVIGGDHDFYCPEDFLRETAEGIPSAKLVIHKGKGHTSIGKQFEEDVLEFLNA